MGMMVGVDSKSFPAFSNSTQIVEAMVRDQSVFCLPGMCFNIQDFFRIVLTVPKEMMVEACDRIADFCYTHNPAKSVDVVSGQLVTQHQRLLSENSDCAMHFSSSSS